MLPTPSSAPDPQMRDPLQDPAHERPTRLAKRRNGQLQALSRHHGHAPIVAVAIAPRTPALALVPLPPQNSSASASSAS